MSLDPLTPKRPPELLAHSTVGLESSRQVLTAIPSIPSTIEPISAEHRIDVRCLLSPGLHRSSDLVFFDLRRFEL